MFKIIEESLFIKWSIRSVMYVDDSEDAIKQLVVDKNKEFRDDYVELCNKAISFCIKTEETYEIYQENIDAVEDIQNGFKPGSFNLYAMKRWRYDKIELTYISKAGEQIRVINVDDEYED